MLTESRETLPLFSTYAVPIDPPRLINLTTVVAGDQSTLRTKAIYSIADDVLTYCIAGPGLPRPTEFAAEKGDGRTLVVLKRTRT